MITHRNFLTAADFIFFTFFDLNGLFDAATILILQNKAPFSVQTSVNVLKKGKNQIRPKGAIYLISFLRNLVDGWSTTARLQKTFASFSHKRSLLSLLLS